MKTVHGDSTIEANLFKKNNNELNQMENKTVQYEISNDLISNKSDG
jgi:hypothetical protein